MPMCCGIQKVDVNFHPQRIERRAGNRSAKAAQCVIPFCTNKWTLHLIESSPTRVILSRSQNGFLLAAAMNSGGASQNAAPRVFRAQRFGVRGLVRALGLVETCLRGRGVCGCAMCAPAARTSPHLRKAASSRRSPKRGARKVPHPGRVHWQRSEEPHKCRPAWIAGFFASLPMMSSEGRVPRVPHSRSQGLAELVPPIGNHYCRRQQNLFCERLRMTRHKVRNAGANSPLFFES